MVTLDEADVIVGIYGKYLQYTDAANYFFASYIPESLLPYPKDTLIEALTIMAEHYYNTGDQHSVRLMEEVTAALGRYVDDEEALLEAAKNFSEPKFRDSFIKGSKDMQKQRASVFKENEYIEKGTSHLSQKQWDEAIKEFTKVIELDSKNALAVTYYNRGNAYANKGEHDKAIADFTTAIEIDPSYNKAYNWRGTVYFAKGEGNKAIADLTKAIEIAPNDAEAYWLRATVYKDKDENDKAEADFKKAKELGYEPPK